MAEFQSIHQFGLQLDIILQKKKKKTKNADVQVWGNVHRNQKRKTFLGGAYSINMQNFQNFTKFSIKEILKESHRYCCDNKTYI